MQGNEIICLLCAVLACFVLGLIAGRFIIPWLRAMKAGQTIREIGPKWHNTKAGTPAMGGLVFISASFAGVAVLSLLYDSYGIMQPPSRTDLHIYRIDAMDEAAEMHNVKAFNMLVLVGMVKMSDHLVKEIMGV